jgi:hypothetical protein
LIALSLLAAPLAGRADSSYEHSTQLTGGQLVNSMKNLGFFSKQMRSLTDPVTERTMIHGNQKAIVSKDYTEIWDLDKEVIIHIDNARKSYSVMTFADMRKMIEEMPAKMAQMQEQMKQQQAKAQPQQGQAPAMPPNLKFDFTVDVKDTGLTKAIETYNAKQQIMTMKMTVTDTNITYDFTDEIWTTPDVPAEMKEARDFDMRFGQKLMQGEDVKDLLGTMAGMRNGGQMAMAQMFGSQPGAADAFAQMEKEMAKIKGTRLVEITRMGGSGTGMNDQQGSANNGSGSNGQGNNNSSDQGTHVGSPGSMLGGALMNAWHKKKAQQQDSQQAATPPPPGPPGEVTLMEMTAQTHNFSGGPVPDSVFQVPAGYKQVQSPLEQGMQK